MVCQSHRRLMEVVRRHTTYSWVLLYTSLRRAPGVWSPETTVSLGITVSSLQYLHLLNRVIFTHFTAWEWVLHKITYVKNISKILKWNIHALLCLILVLVINCLRPTEEWYQYKAKRRGKGPQEWALIIHMKDDYYKYVF